MKNLNLQSLIIIAVLALVTILWGIGSVPLFDPDEPVYAETAREMIKYNDYLSPRIFDNFWYDKPPMYYWLVAASISLFGDGEAAARFPAALMAVATSVMLYFSVSNIFSERAGFWASIVLTTCVEFFYLGKAAVTDTTLLFFMTAALLCYQHKWYWVMYIAMALATVTKGPIGIVFPGAIIFLHLLFTGNLREILKMHVIRGLVVYFAIAAPWYYLMYQAHGMEFINTFLGFHNLTRFTTPEHPDRVLWWYYLPVIILGMFPWTGLLLQSIRASISEASSEELVKMSFFNIWWVFVLLFFSISQTKLVSYILPMFPALAIIIGWNLARLEKQRGESLLSWVIGTVIMFGLLGAGWLIGGNQLPEAFLEASVLSGTTFVVGLVIIWFLWRERDVIFAGYLHAAMGFLTMLIAFSFILPPVADRFSVKTMAAEFVAGCDTSKPLYVDKFLRPGFMYYTGIAGEELLPKTDALQKAVSDNTPKYVVVRRLEFKRLQNPEAIQNLRIVKEKDAIMILEKY